MVSTSLPSTVVAGGGGDAGAGGGGVWIARPGITGSS